MQFNPKSSSDSLSPSFIIYTCGFIPIIFPVSDQQQAVRVANTLDWIYFLRIIQKLYRQQNKSFLQYLLYKISAPLE